MTTSKPRWLELLAKEAQATSIGKAAEKVGRSRTAVSQALAGKYPGDLVHFEKTVLAALELPMAIACPYFKVNLPTKMCHDFSSKAAPTHNPVSMQHWRACQQCEFRCEKKESAK